MTQQDLMELAKQKAAKYQLYPELVCALCEQESSWNTWAIRYEPNFFRPPEAGAAHPHERTELHRGLLPVVFLGIASRRRRGPGGAGAPACGGTRRFSRSCATQKWAWRLAARFWRPP